MAAHVAAGATGRTSPYLGDDLTHLSAPELVGRYQQGDRRALVELVPRMRKSVVGHIAHHLSDPSEVEDLAHDVLAHALAHLEAVDPDRGLWPWLVAMANNRIIDHHRQYDTANTRVDDVRVRETLVPSTRARAEDAFETVELREQRRTLFRMLRHLAPRQRAALVLHAVHGWDADQIAELLGTNRNNVHQLLARARGRARREYLSLTGGHRPWAVVPWPLLWVRDRIRRALQRTRDTVTEWQGALPAAGESVTTAASMAVTVAVVAGMTWAGGPPSAEASSPAFGDLAQAPVHPVEDVGLSQLDKGASAAAPFSSEPTSGDTVRPASGRVVEGDPATIEDDPDSSSPPIGEPHLDAPSVEEPSAEARIASSDRDDIDDGKTLNVAAGVTDDDDDRTGNDFQSEWDCDAVSGPVVCDTIDATEGDTSFERVKDEDEDVQASTEEQDDTDPVSDAEDDADDWDVLTEDNCSLDDTVETTCDTVDDSTV